MGNPESQIPFEIEYKHYDSDAMTWYDKTWYGRSDTPLTEGHIPHLAAEIERQNNHRNPTITKVMSGGKTVYTRWVQTWL